MLWSVFVTHTLPCVPVHAADSVRLAITHFENRTQNSYFDRVGQQLPEMILSELAQYGGVTLLERERVDRLLEERNAFQFDTSAGIDADAILTGYFTKGSRGLACHIELTRLTDTSRPPKILDLEIVPDNLVVHSVYLAREIAEELGLSEIGIPPAPSVPRNSPLRLAVFYLNDNSLSSERLALQKGLTDLIISGLAAVAGVEVVEREDISRLLDERRLMMSQQADDLSYGAFGMLDAVVLGTYMTDRSALRIDLRLVEPRSGVIMAAHRFQTGKTSVDQVEQEIVAWILRSLSVKAPELQWRSAGKTLEALHHYSKALDALDSGNILEAVRAMKSAVYVDPTYSHAHFSVGRLYEERLGEYKLAVESYRRVSRDTASVNRESALVRIGQLSVLHTGDVQTGRQSLRELLDAYPGSIYSDLAHFLMGKAHAGESDRAIEHYTRVIDNYPNSPLTPSALILRGEQYLVSGNASAARQDFQKALAEYPKAPLSHMPNARAVKAGDRAREGLYRLAASESGVSTGGRSVVFFDDFSGGLGGWKMAKGIWRNTPAGRVTVDRIDAKFLHWMIRPEIGLRAFTMEAVLQGRSVDAGFAVRYQDDQNFIGFLVRDGDVSWLTPRGLQNLRPWTRPPPESPIRIKIRVDHLKLQAFVNGEKVSEYIDEKSQPGFPGLYMWPIGDQFFDHIVIYVDDDQIETVPVIETKRDAGAPREIGVGADGDAIRVAHPLFETLPDTVLQPVKPRPPVTGRVEGSHPVVDRPAPSAHLAPDDTGHTVLCGSRVVHAAGDGGMAVCNLDGGEPDLILMACTKDRPGRNIFRYKYGSDLNDAGNATVWDGPHEKMIRGVDRRSHGAGAAVADIDGGAPELILMSYTDGDGPNFFKYTIGWNLSPRAVAGWRDNVVTVPGVGYEAQGAGIAVADLDGGRPDLILMAYDNPKGPNSFRYRVAWNLDTQGVGASRPPDFITVPGVGWGAEGAGVAVTQLDTGGPELILMAYDDPAPPLKNSFRYRIGWNLDASGVAERWDTDFIEVAGMGEAEGGDAAVTNLDGGRPELIFMLCQERAPGDRVYRYKIGWNLNERGVASRWE